MKPGQSTTLDGLIEAARHERDRRLDTYPKKIAAREIDAETASIDYQCWVAIAEWLETDRFSSFYGGADPQSEQAPLIRWPELEAAAKKARDAVERKLAGEGWFDGCTPTATSERRNALTLIHRKLQLKREHMEWINAELRREAAERRAQREIAA